MHRSPDPVIAQGSLRRVLAWVIALIGVWAGHPASAIGEIVDPYTRVSLSGVYRLDVDPSEPDGDGPCRATLSKGGAVLWERELDLTLWDAVVADNGRVFGYAYEGGWWGDTLVGLVFEEDGSELARDRRERKSFDPWNGGPRPPTPVGERVLISEEGRFALVRMRNTKYGDPPLTEWRYDLDTGARIGAWDVTSKSAGAFNFVRTVGAETIPGTPLVAVHWWLIGERSARINVVDATRERTGPVDSAIVWSLDLPGEYRGFDIAWTDANMHNGRSRQIRTDDHRLTVWSHSLGQRRSYVVVPAPEGWQVIETERIDEVPPVEGSGAAAHETVAIELTELEPVTLRAPASDSPIHGVSGIGIDGRGRIGWVRSGPVPPEGDEAGRTLTFVCLEPDGTLVAEIPLDALRTKTSGMPEIAWLSGDRWVLARTRYTNGNGRNEAWFLDVGTGEVTPIEGVGGAWVRRASGARDGGFTLLSGRVGSMHPVSYDANGRRLERWWDGVRGSVDDLAVLTDGRLAVIHNSDTVCVYGTARDAPPGVVTWDIAELLGERRVYVARIRPDIGGGVVIQETSRGERLHRLTPDGVVWRTIPVQGPRGEPFNPYDAWCVDPNGRLWMSDGNRLFKLNQSGFVDRTLGGTDPDTMDTPVALAVGPDARLYAVEQGTARVHVFDRHGDLERVLTPDPGSVSTQDALAWIIVDDDGSIRYRTNYDGPPVGFDADGNFVDADREAWDTRYHFDPNTPNWRAAGRGWEEARDRIRRVDEEGETIVEIRRRASGAWFDWVLETAVRDDGAIAVVSGRWRHMSRRNADEPWFLTVYDGAGRVITERELEQGGVFSGIRFDGDRILQVARHERLVRVIPLDGGATLEWRMPPDGQVVRLYPDTDAGVWRTWGHRSRTVRVWRAP